jgi:hypothetical protein
LAGLDPTIHAFNACNEDVDTRVKPAQDDFTLSKMDYEHGTLEAGIFPGQPLLASRAR